MDANAKSTFIFQKIGGSAIVMACEIHHHYSIDKLDFKATAKSRGASILFRLYRYSGSVHLIDISNEYKEYIYDKENMVKFLKKNY